MESTTKRILAIVLIAIVGVGVGLGAWFFLLTPGAGEYQWSAADCPGAPTDITEDQIIKVGIIGDMARAVGEGQRDAGLLAAEEINTAGGISFGGGKKYYIGIVWEDSDENNPILDTATAVSAAKRLINYRKPHFATGSSRTETALAYQQLFLDEKMIFWNTGAATTTLTQKVLDDYNNSKYYFQISPVNTTALAKNLITLIITEAALAHGMGSNISRFSFMREALAWTVGFRDFMIAFLTNNPTYNLTYTGVDVAFPQDVTPTQMDAHFNTVVAANTSIVIPIISGTAGLTFANSYGDLPGGQTCVPIGINVLGQEAEFWTDTGGRCNYSIGIDTVFETNKTSKTMAFWNAYVAEYGTDPVYTATGTYDVIYQIKWMLENTASFNPDVNVAQLETLTRASGGLEGAAGYSAYDASHSPEYGYPFGVGLAVQWISGAKQFIAAPGLYPSDPYSPVPPFGAMLNQTIITLPPDIFTS
ncbi:MAG: ABC transporter substrate-binding protein [Promethearchaeota archaeon]|jgi:ABC-type branched-subunit amino acid transport system substrate-binding protein